MTSWHQVRAALDEVAAQGRAIRVWWRDDDAGRDHPALARLLRLAESHGLPVALAVVPAWLDANARARIASSDRASVLQHGFAHLDHAPPGRKPIELGEREPEEVAAELERGRSILIEAFGSGFHAVLVPPWNRIEPGVVSILPRLGYVGISTFGPRRAAEAAPGLPHVNTHLDAVDWRGTRLFVGDAAALAPLLQVADVDEPFGILSHHLTMDEPGWRFLDRLLELVAHHPGVRFCAPGELFEAAA